MDALLEAFARLIGTFKDPVNVVFLLVCAAEAAIIYKFSKFLMDRYSQDIESRAKMASVLEQIYDWMKTNGK